MRVFLKAISKEPELGRVRMSFQFGKEPDRSYLGDYDGSDPTFTWCNVEQELFMRLSDLAAKRFCHCGIYQSELMGIIGAFVTGKSLPPFPIELGTTDFGIAPPSRFRIIFNRMRRLLSSAWNWWEFRHIRRQNAEK